MTDNPDEYDFSPSASSNLRSLFDSSISPESSTLVYTAPKQPKPGVVTETKNESPKAESTVICARVVQVWKLTDGKYVATGKHGCAIIGSSSQTSYEIILYKEQRNVVMRAKICPTFEITVKKDNFASCYDNAQDNWLIKFNSQDDCTTVTNSIEKCGGKVLIIPIQDDTKKVEDSSTSENKVKADILSRIAKMGQSILPNKNVEGEEEVDTIDTNISSQNSSENKENPQTSFSYAISPTNVTHPSRQIQNIPNTFVMAQPMTFDPLNIFVAENRAHNSELRMNLSQITEKLNYIMKLVDTDKSEKSTNQGDGDVFKSKIKVLELTTENLLRELKIAQEENTRLKVEMKRQEDLFHKEEQHKLQLIQELLKMEELTKEINFHKEKAEDLSKLVQTQKNEIDELTKVAAQHQDDTKWTNEISILENTISDLQQKIQEREHENIARNLPDEDIKAKIANFTTMLKDEMNGMYANIVGNFSNDQHISEVYNNNIAQLVKSTTLKIIQNFQQIFES